MNAWERKSMGHGGGAPGFSSWIERWPGERAFVAVLSNNGRTPAGEVGRSLTAILFGQEYQLPESREIIRLNPEVLDEYIGTYRIDAQNSRRVVRQGQALFVERGGGQRYPIEPCDKDRFFFAHDRGASIRFIRNDAGVVTGHIFHQLGVDETAKKLTALLDRKD
jgi:D-alanyl-D-alanine carboxypeptidase